MSKVLDLHEQAMDIAEMAFVARLRGNQERAKELFLEAFEMETQAAALLSDNLNAEPTRSVLHRSAASLAFNCGKFDAAERLIAIGLSGYPPEEIAEELRDLFEDIINERRINGVVISLSSDHDHYADVVQREVNGEVVALDLTHSQNLNSVTMTGKLRFADSLNGSQGQIKIVDQNGHKHLIVVPLDMMSDIVKPLYEETVMVTGKPVGKVMTLEDIVKV